MRQTTTRPWMTDGCELATPAPQRLARSLGAQKQSGARTVAASRVQLCRKRAKSAVTTATSGIRCGVPGKHWELASAVASV